MLVARELIVARLNKRDWSTRGLLRLKHGDLDVSIKPGFVTDFASVPQILYSLFPAHGIYILGAIFHDYFLTLIKAGKAIVNSNDADGMLRVIARQEGADYVTAWSIWTGVRWGALFSQDGYRRAGWFLWGNLWRVLVWTVLLFPAILFCVIGVGLAYVWLTLLKIICWMLRLK